MAAPNDYSGATVISAGKLALGVSDVLPDGAGKGDVTVNGTFDLAGNNETINGLSGSKSITRQVFGNGAAVGNYSDLWWGGAAQSGWGLSVTQHGSAVFAVCIIALALDGR